MLDYYQAFLEKYSGNTSKYEPTKPTKDPFARFVSSVINEFPENSIVECTESRQHPFAGNEIFEERVAIMMYDGGVSEAEAIRYLTMNLDR